MFAFLTLDNIHVVPKNFSATRQVCLVMQILVNVETSCGVRVYLTCLIIHCKSPCMSFTTL